MSKGENEREKEKEKRRERQGRERKRMSIARNYDDLKRHRYSINNSVIKEIK